MTNSSVALVGCFVQPFRPLTVLFRKSNKATGKETKEVKGNNSRNSSLESSNLHIDSKPNDDLKSSIPKSSPALSTSTIAAEDGVVVAAPNLLYPTRSTPLPKRTSMDAHSQRTRASTDPSCSIQVPCLRKILLKERVQCPPTKHCFILPKSTQERLITVAAVTNDILAQDISLADADADLIAQEICARARQLYAVLVCIQKERDIRRLLRDGMCDKNLPLIRQDPKDFEWNLSLSSGERIETIDQWDEDARENFDRAQWWMTAPVFKYPNYYEFPDETMLPFISFEGQETLKDMDTDQKSGGYGEVFPVRIHPSHHNFWEHSGNLEDEPLVAVKRLRGPDEQEFLKERTILEALGRKEHQHLIKLLASFKYNKKYHFLFPYADANLRRYWELTPSPDFDRETVLWAMQQMTGIASGLVLVHNFTVTIPLDVPDQMKTATAPCPTVKHGEEMFGRHGDIKPENILWLKNGPDSKGILQIADFGLGRFHGRDSRSKVHPTSIQFSQTYEPPECKVHKPISRAYDIWSLGCLYLEFVTWLLKGDRGISDFSDFRGEGGGPGDEGNSINDDEFFTLQGRNRAVVRTEVKEWVNRLHRHEKCSDLLHKLLDFTMTEMLLIDPKKRCRATHLHQKFNGYFEKAKKDADFLLKGRPRIQPRRERPSSTPVGDIIYEVIGPDRSRARKITFANSDRAKRIQASKEDAKDMVLKNLGAPSVTWPIGPKSDQYKRNAE